MLDITPRQRMLLAYFRALDGTMQVEWDAARGVMARLAGRLLDPVTGPGEARNPVTRARAFLEQYGVLFGPGEDRLYLSAARCITGQDGRVRLTFQQVCAPCSADTAADLIQPEDCALPVYGGGLALLFQPDGTLNEVLSSCWRDVRLSAAPRLSADDVRDILYAAGDRAASFKAMQRTMSRSSRARFPFIQDPRLVVYPDEGAFRLVWTAYAHGILDDMAHDRVDVGRAFVDAVTGEIIRFEALPVKQHNLARSGLTTFSEPPTLHGRPRLQTTEPQRLY